MQHLHASQTTCATAALPSSPAFQPQGPLWPLTAARFAPTSSLSTTSTSPFTAPALSTSADGQLPLHHVDLRSDISSYRAFAVARLLRIERGGAYANLLSGHGEYLWENEMLYVARTLGFRTAPLDSRGQRQVTDLVAGVTRWKRYLDYLIMSYYTANDYERIEPLLQQILRVGVYELVKTETPDHASVNEAVKIGTIALRTGAGKLVNAVLRAIAKHQKLGSLVSPKLDGDGRALARALAVLHSHPVWMIRRWIPRYGQKEAIKLLEHNNTPPIYGIRANAARGISQLELFQKLRELGVTCELSSLLEDFIRVSSGMQAVIQSGLIKAGFCAVQDESAGLVVKVVDPQPGEIVIDCCAAPGGKALYMAACLKSKGKLHAIDIHEGKLRLLEEAARNLGVESVVHAQNSNLCDFASENITLADKVLLDAPCSGLGVLSKRADLRWKKAAEDMDYLTFQQSQLLDAASRLVKPGGLLIYSTCSIEPDENENQVSLFLDKHPDFAVETVEGLIPCQFLTSDGFFMSLPQRHNIDGSFAVRLRKREI